MKFYRSLVLTFLVVMSVYGQNPITPPGVYIADPSAHQWKDGKMYVYGSLDVSPRSFCSKAYDVLSSSDLKTWTLTENSFSTQGPNDQVTYSDDVLYAPDCQYRDGKYYLYYCLANDKYTEGVATSMAPTGPFINGKDIRVKGINEIDPCVFIDDDGQGYYIWGQFTDKMAKLKPNMIEIDSATIKDNIVTEKEHFFHEGGYMVKRNGIYYFVYAHMGRAGRPTCIGYATSKSPMGPFKYGGVIIDNDHCDPVCWNNHGSLAQFNGKWYVFYHRSSHGSNSLRTACVEPINFNEDGSINEVQMTTQGAGEPLKATSVIEAERACLLYGNVRMKDLALNKTVLSEIKSNDAACYKYIDFNTNVDSIKLNVFPGKKGLTLNVSLDDSWGPSIARINIPENGNGEISQIISAKIKQVKGVHAVWITFWGEDNEFKLDWFTFN